MGGLASGMLEVEKHWTFMDVMNAHEALDIKDEMEEYLSVRAEAKNK